MSQNFANSAMKVWKALDCMKIKILCIGWDRVSLVLKEWNALYQELLYSCRFFLFFFAYINFSFKIPFYNLLLFFFSIHLFYFFSLSFSLSFYLSLTIYLYIFSLSFSTKLFTKSACQYYVSHNHFFKKTHSRHKPFKLYLYVNSFLSFFNGIMRTQHLSVKI